MTRFAYFAGHEQFQPEDLVRHAVLAEEAGFDMIEVSEHFHPWVDDLGASGFAYATIAAMAQATERVEFVTGVTTPLWRFHPAVVAQAAATLDRLSGGRFTLGVGTGENLNEGPLGYEFPKYAERAARMSEALDIMRALLDGEKLTFDGEWPGEGRADVIQLLTIGRRHESDCVSVLVQRRAVVEPGFEDGDAGAGYGAMASAVRRVHG